MSATNSRQPHASLDLLSRTKKAKKIERLLDLKPLGRPIRILEIGAGSCAIAHYFATHPELNCEVVAVDVEDQRVVFDGYTFISCQDPPDHLPQIKITPAFSPAMF